MTIEEGITKLSEIGVEYAPKVLMAIITLMVGFWIIKKLMNLLDSYLTKTGMDLSLSKFVSSMVSIGLKIMVLLSVAGTFGVNTTSFIAILGGLAIGVGMALNGSLGQVASGVMLMIFKPFKIGDVVIIGSSNMGKVEAVNAINTTLINAENKRIFVSNSDVIGNTITNITGQGIVGLTLTFGIGYSDDIDKAKEIILRVGKECPLVLDTPEQIVAVSNLGDSSVDFMTRPFCKSEHMWDVRFYMNENVKKEFDKAGVGIPFPQMDVHMINQN